MRFAMILCVPMALQQIAAGDEPTTRPAAPVAVLVLPFESIPAESASEADAITHAMNRSVAANLARSRDVKVIEGKKPAPDRDAAMDLGRVNHAGVVIWGNVQYAVGRLRVNSEVLGVEQRKTIAHFKLTGTLRDLFELEDQLSEKLSQHLSAPAKADEPSVSQSPEQVPASQPLLVARHERQPDWKTPRPAIHDDVTWRYNYRDIPYWYTPDYAYGPYFDCGFGGWLWRPYRPLYGWRMSDVYSYDGLPVRNFRDGWNPMYRFSGPVPARWMRD